MLITVTYWISTILISLLYFSSATLYITKTAWVRETLASLNYPAPYLVPFMIIIKILGPIAILSRINLPLSDLAYAGMFFHLILSVSAHCGVRKPQGAVPAFIGLILLITSFITQDNVRSIASSYLFIHMHQ
ncbi:DoxX family protein [Neokomagataea thailandica]|uniref:DoxX family protein n=1 Tax=Neokomagataea TaxID=1223423 RepID=UPI00082E8460